MGSEGLKTLEDYHFITSKSFLRWLVINCPLFLDTINIDMFVQLNGSFIGTGPVKLW